MGKFSRLGNDLYNGDKSIDFVGKRKRWYAISAVLIAIAMFGLFAKGLNLGIEFEGGSEYKVSLPSDQVTQDNVDKLREALGESGIDEADDPTVNTSGTETILIQTETMTQDKSDQVIQVIEDTVPATDVSQDLVGASWGEQVVNKSITGLVVFLVLVTIFISVYFREWKMSAGALAALAHDIVITVGIYALSGFEVTPATVTGILTILGFSLYDTVVVFDKVRENTADMKRSKRTYSELANLAVNQTLVRSINTSIVALLPVAVILYASLSLGAGALKDLSLSLFVGMAVGAYSSIFIAVPVTVGLKLREKEISVSDARAKARARRAADPYAAVPSFDERMPEHAPLDTLAEDGSFVDEAGESRPTPATAPPRRPEATGRGRTAPPAKGPVGPSGAASRNQPSRSPRSKRK
jgi:preprotein translocase subunit SecF